MVQCRSCGARIFFQQTATGKLIPLDAEPHGDGNVLIVGGLARVCGPLDLAMSPGATRYMPHHAVCPKASERHERAKAKGARR